MTSQSRLLAPLAMAIALAAASLAGCGTSSLTEIAGQATPKSAVAGKPAEPTAPAPEARAAIGAAPSVAEATVKTTAAPRAKDDAGRAPAGDERAAARLAAASLTAIATPGSEAYRIGPQDVIEVAVFKVPELSKTVQVAENGMVSFPLIGQVRVGGATARDVEQDFEKRLGQKYLQDPQITVSVKEYNSQRVTLDGAVKKPGVYPLRGRLTLLQAVAQAGGLEASADTTIVVFRGGDKKQSAARFDLDAIRKGTDADPALEPGDIVVVGTSFAKEAFNNLLKLLPITSAFALL